MENYLQFVTFSDLAVSVSYCSLLIILPEFPLLLYEYFITVFNIVYLEKINQICWLFYWKVHLVNYFLRHKRDLIHPWCMGICFIEHNHVWLYSKGVMVVMKRLFELWCRGFIIKYHSYCMAQTQCIFDWKKSLPNNYVTIRRGNSFP